jgi:O-antigen ligase
MAGADAGAVIRLRLARLTAWSAMLLIVAFNLNYLLVSWLGGGQERYQSVLVAPEVPVLLLFLALGAFYVGVPRYRIGMHAWLLSLSFAAFSIWAALVSLLAHGNPRAAVTLLVPLALFAAAAGVTTALAGRMSRLFARFLPLLPFVTLALLLAFYAAGRLKFEVAGIMKPQILGGIKSSEVAIFAGLQFWYCLFALDVARLNRGRVLLPLLGLAVAAFLLVWLLSVGSVGAVAVLLALRAFILSGREAKGRWLVLFVLGAVLGLGFVMLSGEFLEGLVASKTRDFSEEGVRLPTMLLLLQYIQSSPVAGIGLGQFAAQSYLPRAPEGLYPHNNLLGIAAELGIPAATLYLLFVVMTCWAGFRCVRRAAAAQPRAAGGWPLALLALLAFLYLQIKGLVQDTWQLKETYFWSGAIAGVLAALSYLAQDRTSAPERSRILQG